MNQHNDKPLNYQHVDNFSQSHPINQHNDIPFSFTNDIRTFIQNARKLNNRCDYYEKHFHIIDTIEIFEIFSITALTELVNEGNKRTSPKTVSKVLRFLLMDKKLNLEVIKTNLGKPVQLFYIPSMNPEQRDIMINYYKQINPRKKNKHDKEKNNKIEGYISAYDWSNIQSAGFKQAKKDREAKAKQEQLEKQEQILKDQQIQEAEERELREERRKRYQEEDEEIKPKLRKQPKSQVKPQKQLPIKNVSPPEDIRKKQDEVLAMDRYYREEAKAKATRKKQKKTEEDK